ncbi:MAG: hypothetical protein ABSA44_09795 [Bacteroidota bacterium]|jgi:hypothetical protein
MIFLRTNQNTPMSKKDIIVAIKRFVEKNGRPPTKKELNRANELPGYSTIVRQFKTKNAAMLAAGLVPIPANRTYKLKWTDEELINFVIVVAKRIGHLPMLTEFEKKRDRHMPTGYTYYVRFNKWQIVLRKTGLRFSITRYLLRRSILSLAEGISALAEFLEQPKL